MQKSNLGSFFILPVSKPFTEILAEANFSLPLILGLLVKIIV